MRECERETQAHAINVIAKKAAHSDETCREGEQKHKICLECVKLIV